jgi:hypothetical protein
MFFPFVHFVFMVNALSAEDAEHTLSLISLHKMRACGSLSAMNLHVFPIVHFVFMVNALSADDAEHTLSFISLHKMRACGSLSAITLHVFSFCAFFVCILSVVHFVFVCR